MRISTLLLLLLLTSVSCTPDTSHSGDTANSAVARSDAEKSAGKSVKPQHETTPPDSADFTSAFNQFFQALQNADTAAVNQFIHPQFGVWFIEQPGAVPKMTYFTDVRDFKREYQDRSFFTVAQEVKTCNLQEEPWPAFSCNDVDYEAGTSGYSKDGCFVWTPEKFQKSGYWNYASLPMQKIKRIQTTLPRVQKSVLHTNTSFEFHFGYIDKHWRLLFAKLIYPCSA